MRDSAGLLEVVLESLPGGLLGQVVHKDALAARTWTSACCAVCCAAPLPCVAVAVATALCGL